MPLTPAQVLARRRSRSKSELTDGPSSDEDEDFYDADEYQDTGASADTGETETDARSDAPWPANEGEEDATSASNIAPAGSDQQSADKATDASNVTVGVTSTAASTTLPASGDVPVPAASSSSASSLAAADSLTAPAASSSTSSAPATATNASIAQAQPTPTNTAIQIQTQSSEPPKQPPAAAALTSPPPGTRPPRPSSASASTTSTSPAPAIAAPASSSSSANAHVTGSGSQLSSRSPSPAPILTSTSPPPPAIPSRPPRNRYYSTSSRTQPLLPTTARPTQSQLVRSRAQAYATSPAGLNIRAMAQEAAGINNGASAPTSPPATGSGASSPNTGAVATTGTSSRTSSKSTKNQDDLSAFPFTIKNLDTGETCDLNEAAVVFPEIAQALTLKSFDQAEAERQRGTSGTGGSSNRSSHSSTSPPSQEEVVATKQTLGFLGRIRKALQLGDKGTGAGVGEDGNSDRSIVNTLIKVKAKHRNYQDLSDLKLVQTVDHHAGPIWTVAISKGGDFLATGGQDTIVRVWAVMGSSGARELDEKLRANQQKANQEAAAAAAAAAANQASAAAASSVAASSSSGQIEVAHVAATGGTATTGGSPSESGGNSPVEPPNFEQDFSKESGRRPIVYPLPFRSYAGHKADVIDLAWSKANFLLSASIDKTVRLWHVSRQKCLCVFQHADFVTSVSFHPIEDRYFVSGSFDKKLRIWNIPEHRVVEWAQTSNIITAATFNPNGNMTVAGLYNGQCVFYQTDGLKYFTQVDAKNRHGKNRKGKKVTGMQFAPDGKTMLVTTNDSRIRLYDMDDYSMLAKFKGTENDELQIRAYFSEDGRYVICGGEDHQVHVWSATEYQPEGSTAQQAAASAAAAASSSSSSTLPIPPTAASKTDIKCDSSECFRAFDDTCTSAQFLPSTTIRVAADNEAKHLIVAAGYNGQLKFFENRGQRKTC